MSLDKKSDIVESADMESVSASETDCSEPSESEDFSGYLTEDDTPVDNVPSEKQQRLLTEPLYSAGYAPPPREDGLARTFIATANVGLYAVPKDSPVVPDMMLSLDVKFGKDLWLKKNRTYFAWVMGKLPDVVIEVVSNTEGDELGAKRRRYAAMGIPRYVVWDPQKLLSDEPLQVFELRGDLLVPVKTRYFPEIGLGICVWHGVFEECEDEWLRWCTADGALVPTGAESASRERTRADVERARAEAERKRFDAERKRADAERLRFDAERKRADAERLRVDVERKRADDAEAQVKAERERAERLAEKLRALGVNLD